jgi:ABC-type bacteriocin/lantibiotic exporter with double-glycine peptidase domain
MLAFVLSLGLLLTPRTATVIPTIPAVAVAKATAPAIPQVPFYSQFKDISSPKWQKVGCGIASLAMVVNYYRTDDVAVDTLLSQALASGAYISNAGWSHQGLVSVSKKYGFSGSTYDLSRLSSKAALEKFTTSLKSGPVIASVHYKFDPKNPIPHLVVIDAIRGDVVYYNDPAATGGQKQISVAKFLAAWKQRYIVIRPASVSAKVALR